MLFRLLALLSTACLAIPAQAAEPPMASVGKLSSQKPDDRGRLEMVKVQIALDRAGFRPGKIDGLGGEFTQKAADRYCTAYALPEGSRIDTGAISSAYRDYTLTEQDISWVGEVASKPEEQQKLKRLPYKDTWELLAEKFHTDLDFLKELNPQFQNPPVAGEILRAPDVEPFEMQAVADLEKKRRDEAKARKNAAADPSPHPTYEPQRKLVLLREPRLIELYEDGKLAGCFPCTPGSPEQPVPPGDYKITSNTLLPYFRWDKSVLETGKRSDTAYNLPPGPNNPVGIVWLAINIPSRGIHGTPSPDQIGRNQSHGCVRTANWDAWVLARKIQKGTPVEVR
jgi:lipoprotein-anchoring transpeptidase ErfK/SrfK